MKYWGGKKKFVFIINFFIKIGIMVKKFFYVNGIIKEEEDRNEKNERISDINSKKI